MRSADPTGRLSQIIEEIRTCRMKSVMKRWTSASLRGALQQWQRNMADADIIMLHHNMQFDAGVMLVKHQLNQLVSGLTCIDPQPPSRSHMLPNLPGSLAPRCRSIKNSGAELAKEAVRGPAAA